MNLFAFLLPSRLDVAFLLSPVMAKHQPQRNLTQPQETDRIPFVAMTLSAAAAGVKLAAR
jgi:hypothetical protein